MKRVKCNIEYKAYRINNENDLDEFLANEVDHDSIRKKGDEISVFAGGTRIFSLHYGDWAVLWDPITIKTYSNDEFLDTFSFASQH